LSVFILFEHPLKIVATNTTIGHDSFIKDTSVEMTGTQFPSPSKIGIGEIAFTEIGFTDGSVFEDSFSKIDISKTTLTESSIGKIDPWHITLSETTLKHAGVDEFSKAQVTHIEPTQVGIEVSKIGFLVDFLSSNSVIPVSTSKVSSSEVLFSPSILSNQFFSIHKSTSPFNTETLNSNFNTSNPTNFNLNIKFQIADLPSGQLAEATITGYDQNGRPNSGTLTLDINGNGNGWFIDTTPEDNSEFRRDWGTGGLGDYYIADPNSEAYGKYDLLTTILHELGHLNGIIRGNSAFDSYVRNINGVPTFVDANITAVLTPDGSHLDPTFHPYDLMNTSLKTGIRKLPSALDLAIIDALNAGVGGRGSGVGTITAPLTAGALLAINNGDFTTTANWNIEGATNIINGSATLTEQSQKLAQLTQATLYFNLLGFGARTSTVTIDDVKLFTDTQPAPIATNDTLITNQATPLSFNPTTNDTNVAQIQILTQPTHGTLNPLPLPGGDFTYTYTPDPTYVGTDSFTYLGFDANGQISNLATVNLTINNVVPTIENINIPTNINEGQTVEFTATAFDGGSSDNLIYTWNLGDGSQPISGQNITHKFIDSGTYNITLNVTDSDGGTTQQSTQVTVNNLAPTINTVNIPNHINEGSTVQLTANASDAGNDTLTYNWYINGATTAIIGQTIDYNFLNSGTYPVKLEVIDSDGGITTQTIDVTINNTAPTINSINIPTDIQEGEKIQLTATATDAGNDPLTYNWYINNSTTPIVGQIIDYTFADNGNYNVVLTVTDKDGAVTSQTVEVTVDNVAPAIASIITPAKINEGESVEFKATATDVGVNDTLTYEWNFGDGTDAVIGQNVNHTFADNGNYNVVLTVTDKDGAVTSQTVEVTVDNVAPAIASIITPAKINEGESVEFKATATDVGINDTLTYLWNFGDGTNPVIGDNITKTFINPGTYQITLTVTDGDGGITTTERTITVLSRGIRAGGNVTISGSANLDGDINSRTDDTYIYAGKGLNLNGNVTLALKRDASGNPLKDASGKLILVDNAVAVAPGANLNTNPSKYSNIATSSQTITIPTYSDILSQDFAVNGTPIVYDLKLKPIKNAADWNSKFPPAGTSTNPTVVRIINGDLNLPANINPSNYIFIVENGNINFNQGNPKLNNVTLIANRGNINLNGITATNLNLAASGNSTLSGNSILNSQGNTTWGGQTQMTGGSKVKIVSQGDVSVSGNSTVIGQIWSAKNVAVAGKTTLVGSIDAIGHVSISGNSILTSQ
jgi:PKD repeat protein